MCIRSFQASKESVNEMGSPILELTGSDKPIINSRNVLSQMVMGKLQLSIEMMELLL